MGSAYSPATDSSSTSFARWSSTTKAWSAAREKTRTTASSLSAWPCREGMKHSADTQSARLRAPRLAPTKTASGTSSSRTTRHMTSEHLAALSAFLIVLFALAAVAHSALATKALAESHRDFSRVHKLLVDQSKMVAELASVEYVRQHLQRTGVGGYLVTANERIATDVEAIQKWLGLTPEEAIEYLKSGVRGIQPRDPVA